MSSDPGVPRQSLREKSWRRTGVVVVVSVSAAVLLVLWANSEGSAWRQFVQVCKGGWTEKRRLERAQALGAVPRSVLESEEELRGMLDDPSPSVRLSACSALLRIGVRTPETWKRLVTMARGPDEDDRGAAMLGIGGAIKTGLAEQAVGMELARAVAERGPSDWSVSKVLSLIEGYGKGSAEASAVLVGVIESGREMYVRCEAARLLRTLDPGNPVSARADVVKMAKMDEVEYQPVE